MPSPPDPPPEFHEGSRPSNSLGNPGQARLGPGPGPCNAYDSYGILGGSSFRGGNFHWRFLAAWEAWRCLANCRTTLAVCNSERVCLWKCSYGRWDCFTFSVKRGSRCCSYQSDPTCAHKHRFANTYIYIYVYLQTSIMSTNDGIGLFFSRSALFFLSF